MGSDLLAARRETRAQRIHEHRGQSVRQELGSAPPRRASTPCSLRWSDFPIFDLVYLTADVQLLSGQKYTPMIAGDVNGDGSVNDRAFVFDPTKTD